jgi:hypothetical protein
MPTTELRITLNDPDADADSLDGQTGLLRDELLELDLEKVSRAPGGPAPDGSRGIDPAAIGALIVTLEQSTDLVAKVVETVRGWLKRDPAPNRSVEIEMNGKRLVIPNATPAEQRDLVRAYIAALGLDSSHGR